MNVVLLALLSDSFEYFLLRESPPLGSFNVDRHSGRLSTTRPLDREQIATHRLVLGARDLDRPEMTSQVNVTVFVADRNDNAPVITYPTDQQNSTVEVVHPRS